MKKSTQQLTAEFFDEALNGCVILETNHEDHPWRFGVHFFTKINGKSNATDTLAPEVQIPNFDTFIEELETYLSVASKFYADDQEYFDLTDNGFSKKLISDLFASATNFDINNIVPYIKTRTALLQNPIPTEAFEIGQINNSTIGAKIKKNRSNLEGPYNIEFFATNKNETYPLPSITFGIADNDVYVYAVKYFDSKQTDPVTKKTIHSIVDGKPVLDTKFKQETNDFFHGNTRNSHAKGVERNISPNALVSLSLFLSLFKDAGTNQIIAPNFMPIRYETNRSAIEQRALKNHLSIEDQIEKHNNDQNNITNKFMYLLSRYNHHFPECEMEYDEIKEEMRMKLAKTKSTGENLIYQIDQIENAPEPDNLSK